MWVRLFSKEGYFFFMEESSSVTPSDSSTYIGRVFLQISTTPPSDETGSGL